MNKNKNNQLQIRNSTVDFLIFTRQNDENGIAVRIEDENVWLRVEAIAELFQKSRPTIVEHLQNIFATRELDENSVCRKFRHTADDGKNYQVKFYNLEAMFYKIKLINQILINWLNKVNLSEILK